MKLILFIFIFFKGQIIFASEFPDLFGCLCEGGLITGKISKKDKISIDGFEMKTFDNGEFIFAFGRKFKNKIDVEYNGKFKIFDVKKKKYKIERISGLPQKKVEPAEEDIKRIIKDIRANVLLVEPNLKSLDSELGLGTALENLDEAIGKADLILLLVDL